MRLGGSREYRKNKARMVQKLERAFELTPNADHLSGC